MAVFVFKSDAPIKKIDEDLLNRSNFSKSLADAILSYHEKESIVTGLYGKWGSGKSSVINMCLEQIKQSSESLPDKNKPVVINFNPWNYSDQSQLVFQFFKQLSIALKKNEPGSDLSKIADRFEIYAEFFGAMAVIPEASISVFSAIMSKATKLLGSNKKKLADLKKLDLEGIRGELNSLLAKQERKIIIVIDDIDRLTSTEIRQIFQLVKMLGDFPNTVYLLSFDAEVVVESLKDVQAGLGQEYLEKIVQIPFELPDASLQLVYEFLSKNINILLQDTADGQWDDNYFQNIFHSGFNQFFSNLRDVTRYINTLRFGFGAVKEYVNLADFMAITALQVFEPEVYRGIRDNKGVFSGVISESLNSTEQEINQLKVRCDEILARSKRLDEIVVKEFLTQLFPKLLKVYGNTFYGNDFLSGWRLKGRICSPDIFDVFFKLSLADNEISNWEMRAILSASNDRLGFAKALIGLKEGGRIIRFLERMEDFTRDEIPEENIYPIVHMLMETGDYFPKGREIDYYLDSSMRISRITTQLGKRLSQVQRFEMYKSIFQQVDNSLAVMIKKIAIFSQENDPNSGHIAPINERSINPEQLKIIQKIGLDKIRDFARNKNLIGHRDLLSILYRWRDFSGGSYDEPRAFLEGKLNTASNLINVARCFIAEGQSQGANDYVPQNTNSVDLRDVHNFLDLDSVIPKIRQLIHSDCLTKEEVIDVQLFIDTCDGKIQEF